MLRFGDTSGSADTMGAAMTEPALPMTLRRGTEEAALITSSRSISRRTLLNFSAKAGAWNAARSAFTTAEAD